MSDVRMHPSWKNVLADEFQEIYWQELTEVVRSDYQTKKVYPPAQFIFRAFDTCPFDQVKVVIVGQDPYHGAGQANGLSFAVREGVAIPPSLQNIFKEIEADLGIKTFPSGDLTRWAKQGVLMLNSVLTVLANQPTSHKGLGWENFTDAVVEQLNAQKTGVVYLLWGKYAHQKGARINRTKNLVLESGHPSPFSAQLFFGHHQFGQTNTYLQMQDKQPIDWR
jgi:uracil-DNA glycosylase